MAPNFSSPEQRPLATWCCCPFYQEIKSISLTPLIWAGLVTYFYQLNVEEAILCRLQRASRFHFYSLGIQLPHEKTPASLLESALGGERRHPAASPRQLSSGPASPYSICHLTTKYTSEPTNTQGAQTSCQTQNCGHICGGCFKPLSFGGFVKQQHNEREA